MPLLSVQMELTPKAQIKKKNKIQKSLQVGHAKNYIPSLKETQHGTVDNEQNRWLDPFVNYTRGVSSYGQVKFTCGLFFFKEDWHQG